MASPEFNLDQIEIFVGRTVSFTFDLYKIDGDPLAIDVGNTIHVNIWDTDGAAPQLAFDDSDTTSRVTVDTAGDDDTPARITLVFDETETAGLEVGLYNGECYTIDAADGDKKKPLFRLPVLVTGSAS